MTSESDGERFVLLSRGRRGSVAVRPSEVAAVESAVFYSVTVVVVHMKSGAKFSVSGSAWDVKRKLGIS